MKSFQLTLFLISFVFFPVKTNAVVFYAHQTNHIAEKEIRVTLSIDAENEKINAYEGLLEYNKNKLFLKYIDTSNSIVTSWVKYPELDNAPTGGGVFFEGLTVGGFDGVIVPDLKSKQAGKLFTAVFSAQDAGDSSLSFSHLSVYKDDGEGTEVAGDTIKLPVNIPETYVKNQYLLNGFKVPRVEIKNSNDLYVALATTTALYDGRPFLIFENLNKQKSVNSFEISESPAAEPSSVPDFSWTKARSPYLLAESGLTRYIHLKANYSDGSYTYKTLQTVEKVPLEESLSYILMILTLIVISIFYATTLLFKKD